MEVKRVYYNNDDILISAHLIKRRFKNPVFYPFGNEYGFSYEIISKEALIVECSTEAYRRFYKDTYLEGTRALLVKMGNNQRLISDMTKNIVDFVDCLYDKER